MGAELANTQARTGESAKAYQRAERSARSSSSLLVRTRRTRITCPTLLLSSSLRSRLTSSRLKRLRRSLLSTWPSSGSPAGAGGGRGEGQACFPHLNFKHSSEQLKLEENLFAANSNSSQLLTPE